MSELNCTDSIKYNSNVILKCLKCHYNAILSDSMHKMDIYPLMSIKPLKMHFSRHFKHMPKNGLKMRFKAWYDYNCINMHICLKNALKCLFNGILSDSICYHAMIAYQKMEVIRPKLSNLRMSPNLIRIVYYSNVKIIQRGLK